MSILAAFLDNLWHRLHGGITLWTIFGLIGNVLFSSRFFVQWYVSEKLGRSVIPVSFWYLSLVGSVVTSIYAIHLGFRPVHPGRVAADFHLRAQPLPDRQGQEAGRCIRSIPLNLHRLARGRDLGYGVYQARIYPMQTRPRRLFTEEEYLLIERAAEFKSEYIDGEIFPMYETSWEDGKIVAMAGAGRQHGRIVSNISGMLYTQFQGRDCEVFANDLRVRVSETGTYTYPDVVALAAPLQMLDGSDDTLLNPQLIVEVLSPSTARYDLGEKCLLYRGLESLTDHVLVEQRLMWIQHWSRDAGRHWKCVEYDQASDVLRVNSLQVELILSKIYDRVVFPATR